MLVVTIHGVAIQASAQVYTPPLPAPAADAQGALPSSNVNERVRANRPDAPDAEHVFIESVTQEVNGPWRYLRGMVRLETTEMQLKADELDYNADTGYVEARGHVHFEHFARGEKIDCDKVEYNIEEETGKFYNVTGTAPSRIAARPGLLTTQNPFYFQSKWAERLKDHYILHDGFLTDCVLPRAWWVLRGPTFDVVPGDHATAHRSWFYLRGIRLFYAPYFYKSLKKEPRKSGFLVPNIGRSSLHGIMTGFGYYWAINRSYDLTYRGQYFSQAGLAHHAEFRGKINSTTDFDLSVFGIKDTQQVTPSASGIRVILLGKSDLGNGWEARGSLDYLSSLTFLQNFTQSFNEAVFSETHSVGFITKHWSDFGVDFVAQRNVNFQSTTPGDTIEIRKLPEVDFTEREHQINIMSWPLWVSFDSSAGLLHRSQPLIDGDISLKTAQFVDRLDFAPHVTTAFRAGQFAIVPTFGIRETAYGASFENNLSNGPNVLRSTRDVTVDLILPSLDRIFNAPLWLGTKVKHVIEPRITYKYVTGLGVDGSGVETFQRILRFDENDIVTNTNQVEFSLTNRLLAKDKNGTISDFLTWQLRYARYFDPTFGGAVVAGQRNVIASSVDITGFAFLDGPRHYSPVVSVLRVQSKVGLEWRMDYDPLHHGISNSSVTIDGRINQYFWSFGHTDVKTDPVLGPNANQLRLRIGYGNPNRRGWNSGFDIYYDIRQGTLQYWQTQATYNTDCCGFSVQYRRFVLGTRDDSQIEAAFAISNLGTFGTLRKQERMF